MSRDSYFDAAETAILLVFIYHMIVTPGESGSLWGLSSYLLIIVMSVVCIWMIVKWKLANTKWRLIMYIISLLYGMLRTVFYFI